MQSHRAAIMSLGAMEATLAGQFAAEGLEHISLNFANAWGHDPEIPQRREISYSKNPSSA